MIFAFILLVYVIGLVLTARALNRHWVEEFGREDEDPGDYATRIYWATVGGIVWPLTVLMYVAWLIRRRPA